MKRVLLEAPILSNSGYGQHARFILRALKAYPDKFKIYISPRDWALSDSICDKTTSENQWIVDNINDTRTYVSGGGVFDISIVVGIPSEWVRRAPLSIGATAFAECSKISYNWVAKTNISVDKVITISDFCKQIAESSSYDLQNGVTKEITNNYKITVPIDYVNYPVRKIDPVPFKEQFSTDFNFLLIAQHGPRKNVENTVKWFVEEFFNEEDVGIVMKVHSKANCTMDKFFMENLYKGFLSKAPNRKCKIHLVHGSFTDAELHGLYVHPQINAFVNLSHGEGFGLPIFEAAYSGLPVITHSFGGQTDFLMIDKKVVRETGNKKKTIKVKKPMFREVEYELKNIQPQAVWPGVLDADAKWAFPLETSAKKAMRDVYNNYKKYKDIAEKLKTYLQTNFTEEIQYQKLSDSICSEKDFEIDEWLEQFRIEEK